MNLSIQNSHYGGIFPKTYVLSYFEHFLKECCLRSHLYVEFDHPIIFGIVLKMS